MLKQQHYTLTNVKKVKSQSTTPLKALSFGIYETRNSLKHLQVAKTASVVLGQANQADVMQ